MAATSVAASLSVARGLGKPLAAVGAGATSVRATPRRAAAIAVRASAQKQQQQPVKEWAAAAAVAAALVIPEVAEAAQPGLSPSLKNFLLSILSGGVVLVAIVGAVVAVSNFDPVKRG
ncbi:hypothetical protein PR202_ga25785 [Eleusine coracana subsp. coracana]|uniref:Ultraviolet-B-repressible protein n=1 Tax=Eleusine coracana subsp. coracana TaxID=191504 RepID=A0AAV5DC82_ELECO|nr:hypothetical protein QOZ80_3AG0247830 [Eleusine coracana subsp. coracana]GJN07912.1 hypothetical protein PR202_ga25785 [Eleusine coracana subsp. coracana]